MGLADDRQWPVDDHPGHAGRPGSGDHPGRGVDDDRPDLVVAVLPKIEDVGRPVLESDTCDPVGGLVGPFDRRP